MIHRLNSEVMHEVRQTFCLDLFSMFDKTGSRELFNFVVLSRYANYFIYEEKAFRRAYNTHADFQGEISGEKSAFVIVYTGR